MFNRCSALMLLATGLIGTAQGDLDTLASRGYFLGAPRAVLTTSTDPSHPEYLLLSCVYFSSSAAPGAMTLRSTNHYADVAFFGAIRWKLTAAGASPAAALSTVKQHLLERRLEAAEALCVLPRTEVDNPAAEGLTSAISSTLQPLLSADLVGLEERNAAVASRTLDFLSGLPVSASLAIPSDSVVRLNLREWNPDPARRTRIEFFRPTFKLSPAGCALPDASNNDPTEFALSDATRPLLTVGIDPTRTSDHSRELCRAIRTTEALRLLSYCVSRTVPVDGVAPALYDASAPICSQIEAKLGRLPVREAIEGSAAGLSRILSASEPRLTYRARAVYDLFGGNVTISMAFASFWDLDFDAFTRARGSEEGWISRSTPPILDEAAIDAPIPVSETYNPARDRLWLTMYTATAAGARVQPSALVNVTDRNAHRLCRLNGKLRALTRNVSRASSRSARSIERTDSEEISCECERIFNSAIADLYFNGRISTASNSVSVVPRPEFGGLPRSGSCVNDVNRY